MLTAASKNRQSTRGRWSVGGMDGRDGGREFIIQRGQGVSIRFSPGDGLLLSMLPRDGNYEGNSDFPSYARDASGTMEETRGRVTCATCPGTRLSCLPKPESERDDVSVLLDRSLSRATETKRPQLRFTNGEDGDGGAGHATIFFLGHQGPCHIFLEEYRNANVSAGSSRPSAVPSARSLRCPPPAALRLGCSASALLLAVTLSKLGFPAEFTGRCPQDGAERAGIAAAAELLSQVERNGGDGVSINWGTRW